MHAAAKSSFAHLDGQHGKALRDGIANLTGLGLGPARHRLGPHRFGKLGRQGVVSHTEIFGHEMALGEGPIVPLILA
jgi:hypothetical protein